MKVGLVCPYSLTVPGGVQAQVLGLAEALASSGHQVRVLAPCDGPPPAPWVTPLGNTVQNPTNGSMAPLAPDPAAQIRTIRALWAERFDVLHLHEPLVPGPTATALMVKSAPTVGTFHAAGSQPAYRAMPAMVRYFGARIDVKVAVSEDALALIEPVMGGEWTVLFNGVPVERFASAVPWPTEGRTVMFVGRHEERKGLGVLLDAMSRLPADVRLWVAGDGPLTDELRRRHGGDGRIEWLGRISDAERDRRLAGASVFCAPALHGESFGVVLLEGMAAGTPVVCSDVPGYAKVAGGGRFAEVCRRGDPDDLARALLAVLDDTVNAKRLVEAGRGRAAEFSMERLARLYEGLYRVAVGTYVGMTERPADRTGSGERSGWRAVPSATWRHGGRSASRSR